MFQRSYQVSGIPAHGHVGVQSLQHKDIPLFELIPQSLACYEVDVGHEGDVPHTTIYTRKDKIYIYIKIVTLLGIIESYVNPMLK